MVWTDSSDFQLYCQKMSMKANVIMNTVFPHSGLTAVVGEANSR